MAKSKRSHREMSGIPIPAAPLQQEEMLKEFAGTNFVYSNVSLSSGNQQEFRILFGDQIPGQPPTFRIGIVMPLTMARRLAETLPITIREIEQMQLARQP